MPAPRRITLVVPGTPTPIGGNGITAARWAEHLTLLGHRPQVVFTDQPANIRPCDVVVGLHALKSADSVDRVRRATATAGQAPPKLVVALTGTDLYPELTTAPKARAQLEAANALVVLHEGARDALPQAWRSKIHVVRQSAVAVRALEESPFADDGLDVLIAANLRTVKDPMLAVRAVAKLRKQPPSKPDIPLRLHLCGASLDQNLEAELVGEIKSWDKLTPSQATLTWHGGIPHDHLQQWIASADAMLITSKNEGGSNVLSEAVVADLPVLTTAIQGSLGLLGDDHPGAFPIGDVDGCAAMLAKFWASPTFRAELKQRSRTLAPIFAPEAERAAWSACLASLR